VDYRADLLNLRTASKLKLPQLTGGGTDQAAATKRRKKHYTQANHMADYARVSAYIPTAGLDCGGVTPELTLTLKSYCS
jgi:hypothetical protein